MASTLTIDSRFNGPPHSGNGGYVAGLLAGRYVEELGELSEYASVQVTLRKPPPLETALSVRPLEDSDVLRLMDGKVLIAEAEAVESDPADATPPIDPVTWDEAVVAVKNYLGVGDHPFLTCFVCGPNHPTGLHIYPGAVEGRKQTVAATWIPEESAPEFVWAALDCPSGWSPGDLAARPMVLGRMTARIEALPAVGSRCVVLGRHVRTEGRKSLTCSTLYGPDGEVLAQADAVWIAVDPSTVRPEGFSS
jgi:hypothetical protein